MSVGQLSTVGELGGGEGVGLFYGAVFSEKPRPLGWLRRRGAEGRGIEGEEVWSTAARRCSDRTGQTAP